MKDYGNPVSQLVNDYKSKLFTLYIPHLDLLGGQVKIYEIKSIINRMFDNYVYLIEKDLNNKKIPYGKCRHEWIVNKLKQDVMEGERFSSMVQSEFQSRLKGNGIRIVKNINI